MVCDVLLDRLCGLTCHLFDLIGAAVVPVGAVQPGHGGDVLLDVGRNAHRFQDLFEPFVVGQIHSRDRVSQRPGVSLGEAVNVEDLRPGQLVNMVLMVFVLPQDRRDDTGDVGGSYW